LDNLFSVAEQFTLHGTIINIREFGNGNINTTFLVSLDSEAAKHFVLQRVNTAVFRHPELVMQNMRIVTGHLRQRLERMPPDRGRRWEVPRVLLTRDGQDHHVGPDGSFWRAISFIEGAQSFETINNDDHAREVGHALGTFHDLLNDLPSSSLADTLRGFHITPDYLRHYDEVLRKYGKGKSAEANYCAHFIRERSGWAHVLENAKTEGKLHLRPIHGDPKVNNVMIDNATGQAVSIVDLDTVKPGLVHYDIGDCLRSGCNPLGEEPGQLENVRFDPDLCRAILHGYFSAAKEFLTENDREYLYDSVRLIAFELGLRFYTDFLEGDVYFRARRPEHNLVRALVQFRLTESIESQEAQIRTIIRDMG
jgi:Ser/Thr protein kinase RdoA (MazF antagonist)